MFVALPKVFESLGVFGTVLGLAFFLMVTFAALTSAVSILEATVSSCIDKWGWSRKKSVMVMGVSGIILSTIVCLGYNVWYFEYELPNGATAQILDIFDYVTNNLLMPVLSICTCVMFGWIVKPNLLVGEMRLNGYSFHRKYMYIVMLRFIVPVILFILLLSAFGVY